MASDDETTGQSSTSQSQLAPPASKWTILANEFTHLSSSSSSAASEGTGTVGSFSWKDVPFNMLPTKKKSDDLCAVLLAEVDRSAVGQRDPARHFMSIYEDEDVLQDLLVCSSSHWLLSSADAELKAKSDDFLQRTSDIVGDMTIELPWNVDRTLMVIPAAPETSALSVREVHQLIRELVVGIYVFNQIPEIDLVTNYERCTLCCPLPAYRDTTIGQAMINVAYAAGCLRYGGHFNAENRQRFAAEWRSRLNIDVSGQAATKRQILLDFLHAGLQDITQVPGYDDVYKDLRAECLCHHPSFDHADASVELYFSVKQVYQQGTAFLTVPDVDVVSRVAEWTDRMENDEETLREHLRIMVEVVRKNLHKNDTVNRSLEKLKLVTCFIPMLIGLKRRNKIPNLAYLVQAFPRKEMMTERELPPLMSSPDFVNRCYCGNDRYFGLRGGICMSLKCPVRSKNPPPQLNDPESLRQKLAALDDDFISFGGEGSQDETKDGNQPLPNIQVGGNRYDVVELKLETFVAKNCRKPVWANQLHIEMTRLRFKVLPLTTTQLNERFRKIFGPLRHPAPPASNDVEGSLFAACKYKMVSVVHALLREVHADRLERQNADGWSLMHSAVLGIHNVGQLQQQGLNVNTRRFMYNKTSDFGEPLPDSDCIGATPLHLIARFGAVETAMSLLAWQADPSARDDNGWSPIHYACYYDQMPVVRLLLGDSSPIACAAQELPTEDRWARTPLLLCSVSGALQTMKWLLANGCQTDVRDSKARNLVHLATLHSKIHMLKHLAIHGRIFSVQVWHTLSEMLKSSDVQWQVSAIKSVGVLMTSIPTCFKDIVDAGLPEQLVSLMKQQPMRQSDVAVTLSTMSHTEEVQRSLVQTMPLKILVKLMNSDDEFTCARAASIISDVAATQLAKDVIGEHGGFPALARLLAATMADNVELLLSALRAVTSLCLNHRTNKDNVSQYNLIHVVVDLLVNSKNDDVRSLACSALMVIADQHACNQSLVTDVSGSLDAIRRILAEQEKPALQKKAAELLRVLAQSAHQSNSWSESGVIDPMISLLKGLDLELKEEAAQALWMMAGTGRFERKLMAQRIGTMQVINMLMSKSEILVGTCCPLVSAVVYEDIEEQNKFIDEGGLAPLLRLISADTSSKILEGVLRTLATLCLGVDHKGNKRVQRELSKQDLIGCLIPLFERMESRVQAQALRLVACLAINRLKEVDVSVLGRLSYADRLIAELLHHEMQGIRLCVAEALALFVYNKNWSWSDLMDVPVSFEVAFFEHFLRSADERHQCLAAYLIALLGSLVRHRDKATCTVVGIEMLVSKLGTDNDDIFILAVSLLCSLARGRTGIADALVVLGLVELLMPLIDHHRRSCKCASTLACLSHSPTARRRLLSNCRRRPEFYDTLLSNLPSGVELSQDFIQEFNSARQKGLPSESSVSKRAK